VVLAIVGYGGQSVSQSNAQKSLGAVDRRLSLSFIKRMYLPALMNFDRRLF